MSLHSTSAPVLASAQNPTPECQQQTAYSAANPAIATDAPPVFLGESLAARRLRTQVARVAPYLRTALIVGEPGSGKQQVARMLHHSGTQPKGPFVPCSASAFAEALFGECAAEDLTALLESARGGTLYLHGIEELAYPLQGSLGRFLAERERTRTGQSSAADTVRIPEMRIIAGTRRDLRTMSSIGQFRSDLYAILSVLEIRIPALHERTEDLSLIADCMLQQASRRTGLPPKTLSPAAVEKLTGREWSGNLRELEQAIVHASALAHGPAIEAAHLPPLDAALRSSDSAPAAVKEAPEPDRLQDVVQRHVLHVLTRCRGNKLRAAEILGISRSTLYRMLDAGPFLP